MRAGDDLAWVDGIESDLADPVQRLLDELPTAPGATDRGLVVLDRAGTIVAVSPNAATLLGRAPKRLLGLPSFDPHGTSVSEQGTPLPDDQLPARRTMATGEAVTDVVVGTLIPGAKMAGHTRWLNVSSYPAGSDTGAIVVQISDISETTRGRAAADNMLATYRLLGRPTADVVLRIDPNGAVLWASDSVAWVLGERPETLIGQHVVTKVHPDDVPAVAGLLTSLRHNTDPARLECRWRISGGRFRWMATQARPMTDGHGNTIGAVVGLHDINSYVLDRQALAEAQQQYRLLAENATDAVMLMDSGRACVWASPATEQVLGIAPADLIGSHLSLLVHPEDLAELRAGLARVGAEDPGSDLEARLRNGSGEYRWMSIASGPALAPDGTPVGQVITLRDIHQQVIAQAELSASERRFARMFAEHGAMMLLVDPKTGRIVDANAAAARFYGYSVNELRSMSISQINMIAGNELARSRTDAASHRRNAFLFPHRLANGQIRTVEVHSSPFEDRGKSLLFSIIRDVTERDRLESQLRQAAAVFDNTLEAVVITDAKGLVQQANPAFTAMTGWDPVWIVGLDAQVLGGSGTKPGNSERIRSAIVDGTEFRGEFSIRHADATESPVLLSISPVMDSAGEVDSFVWVITDIADRVTSERALSDSERRFRLLAQNATDVVYQLDTNFTITWISPSVEAVLGWRPDELTGTSVVEIVHPADRSLAVRRRDSVLQGQSTPRIEMRLRSADGDYRWMSIQSRPINDADGNQAGVIVGLRDVDQEIKARLALATSENRYRLLAENATDVVVQTSGGIIEWVSPAVESVLGWQPADMIGKAVAEFVHPQDEDVLASRRAQADADTTVAQYEIRVGTADGSFRWMASHTKLTVDEHGVVTGAINGLRDIHEEVLARQALASSEQTFRLAMEGSPQGMAVVALDGMLLTVNDALCRLVDRDSTWLRAHRETDLLHPDEWQPDGVAREQLLAGQAEYHVRDSRLLTPDGGVIWVLHSIALIRDDAGEPQFYVSHYQDVTEARAARENLLHRAQHDPLTGLANRDRLLEWLGSIMARTPRVGTKVAVLFADLDFFKEINDEHGHLAGDLVLRLVAERLEKAVREQDLVARIGGDEFVVVLYGVRDESNTQSVADKLRTAVATPVTLASGAQVTPRLSIGAAMAHRNMTPEQILNHADAALASAKRSGRDVSTLFTQPSPRPTDGNAP
ncbi:MAG: PAS domain S-box protein [Actinomycetes bacterium]